MRHRRYDSWPSFVDLLCNILLAILFLYILTLPHVTMTQAKKEGVDHKAEYLIIADWPKTIDADVDLYVQDPAGAVVWFSNKDKDLMHLDHDSQGSQNNKIRLPNGQIIENKSYQEIVTLRGIVPGEYTVNIHLYSAKGERGQAVELGKPFTVPVTVDIIKLNPTYSVQYTKVITLDKVWEEKTVTRFTLNATGTLTGLDSSPKGLKK